MTAAELRALIAGAEELPPYTVSPTARPEQSLLVRGDSYRASTQLPTGVANLIAALVNNAERFAELLAAEERGLWVSPVDCTGRWDFYRGTTHLGTVRQGMKLFDWVSSNERGYCGSLSEARAAVEAAVRAGR